MHRGQDRDIPALGLLVRPTINSKTQAYGDIDMVIIKRVHKS